MRSPPSPRDRIRVLFVAPSQLSSGEAITVLHMAEQIARQGGQSHCLASPFTARFLAPRFGQGLRELTDSIHENRLIWNRAIETIRPHAVVFADYPLLFFSNGTSPLVTNDWLDDLRRLDVVVMTLDHVGYAQREMRICFGPPHLSLHSECTPVPLDFMQVLRPCPMNAPDRLPGRMGDAFRIFDLPLAGDDLRRAGIREKLADGSSLLIVHTISNWAWRIAEDWGLPHYRLLARAFEDLFRGVHRRVTVVSVNNGALLAEVDTPTLRITNSGILARDDYEALLDAADLLITDNAISVTIGRAICAGTPVVALRNRRSLLEIVRGDDSAARALVFAMEEERQGAVFPFDVFPIWNAADVDELGLFRGNSVTEGFVPVELFGGAKSASLVRELLEDDEARARLRERQRSYADRVAALPDAHEMLCAATGPGSKSR